MALDDAQKQRVAAWIKDGLKLAEIQTRIEKELGLRLTYMDVRLLVDDLKLVPKDVESSKPVDLSAGSGPAAGRGSPLAPASPTASKSGGPAPAAADEPGSASVTVTVDQLARPGAVVSGQVTFSDGKQAEWYLDQLGRLGMAPKDKGYKPSAVDIQEFQYELQNQLAKLGF